MNLFNHINRYHVVMLLWLVGALRLGLAEDFQSRPTLALMDETVAQGIVCGNAVHERGLALNRDQPLMPYAGLRQPYFAALQQELEGLVPSYINHVSGPLNANKTAFLFFSLATWRAAAGLNASGFQRSTNGMTFTYGIAQAGDIIGPWIWEDLRKGYGALRWSVVAGPFAYERLTGVSYSGKTNWLESVVEAEANYLINAGGAGPLGVIEATYASSYSPYRTTIRRTVSAALILNRWSSDTLSHLANATLYLRAQKYDGGEIGAHNSVFDNNGLTGLTGNMTWDVIDTFSSPFTVGQQLQFIEDDRVPARCVDPKFNSNPQGAFRGFYSPDTPAALLKWSFAN